jgi:hypothetical protein
MNENLQEDWLDAKLREEAPYIDDAGFTAKVLHSLPAARPRRSFRGLILICLTLFGSILTYAVSDGGKFIGIGIDRIATLPVLWIAIFAIGCSIVLTSIATAAAFAQVRDRPIG